MTVERRLSEVLSEFARTLATDFPIQAILDHLVVQIVGVLPIDGAGVTLISPGSGPKYIAASDKSALRFENLQTELGDGPCVEAYTTGEAVSVPDLYDESRFEAFTARAIDEGLRAVFTFPLRQSTEQLGALDLYRTTPGPLDAVAMAAAQTLADVASAYLLNARARAALVESSERAEHIALHDGLTGLPNRTLLIQRLEHAMLRCRRSGKVVAVLFVDLDRFKQVNDTHGHRVGDELLAAVADKLTLLLRPGDTVARLAGDEFAILCEDLDHRPQVDQVATRIETALEVPFELSGTDVYVSASIGIAFARADDRPEDVLQAADTAMYRVKGCGGAHHARIDTGSPRIADDRLSLQRDLAVALKRDELFALYQPIVDTHTGEINGAEALLRWEHPTLGTVGPDRIVAPAEHTGLIVDIGRWMLERACLDRLTWEAQSAHPVRASVNVSPQQLMTSGYVQGVTDVLASTGTDPRSITLEITESLFLHDVVQCLVVLRHLKELGVSIALDDFGTGFSSLSYLQDFPVDVVKIDRKFIKRLDGHPESTLIVKAIVDLAHSLHMNVVAEGVETDQQRIEIGALECDAWQGYFCARPMPSLALSSMIEASHVTNSFAPNH